MIVIGDAPLGRDCALACAACSSAGPAAASAAPVRSTLRRSISLSSAVGWLTISPYMTHRSHAVSRKIEAWLLKSLFLAQISSALLALRECSYSRSLPLRLCILLFLHRAKSASLI